MDFVYVVVSKGKDTYLEQTILSIESLRRTNPDGNITVLVDQGTAATLVGRRHKVYDVADEVKVVTCPEGYNNKLRSRYLKTTMYSHMAGDFVYIDGDTLVCGPMDDVAGDYDIGGVPDRHFIFSKHPLKETLETNISPCGYRVYGDKYFNGGFMYVRRSERAERLFRLWEELWKASLLHAVSQDQPSLNEANYRMEGVIHELSGIWNCQISRHSSWLPYLHDAKIIHYFASNEEGTVPYLLSDDDLLRHALDDVYPAELQTILDNPKAAFSDSMRILSHPLRIEIYESEVFNWVYKLCRNKALKALFSVANGIVIIGMWPYRTIKEARRRRNEKGMGKAK